MALNADHGTIGGCSTSPQALLRMEGNSSKKRDSIASSIVKISRRRAAHACVSCRARKVRCDGTGGAPCGNCRWDSIEVRGIRLWPDFVELECIVQDARQHRKTTVAAKAEVQSAQPVAQARCETTGGDSKASSDFSSTCSPKTTSMANTNINYSSNATDCITIVADDDIDLQYQSAPFAAMPFATVANARVDSRLDNLVADGHLCHMIYQRYDSDLPSQASVETYLSSPTSRLSTDIAVDPIFPFDDAGSLSAMAGFHAPLHQFHLQVATGAAPQLPPFLRPLPSKIAPEDVCYLRMKGALTLPTIEFQSVLLQAYIEFIHPFMPLVDIHPFLRIVSCRNGFNGQMSLLLYNAVLFAATPFVDVKCLYESGFTSRKASQKAFFQRTRLLYDFEYESDRLILVQSVLLMTYWCDTPDETQDTWHWMGVAISLAHTIGLHCKPDAGLSPTVNHKLRKRIWWSCFMRDKLIALSVRRPARIKDEDFNVPMLVESDFEIQSLAEKNAVLPSECKIIRDVAMQRELAAMCISKAKLCRNIGHMLETQYSMSILDNTQSENAAYTRMSSSKSANDDAINTIDTELRQWVDDLPECCRYHPLTEADVDCGRSTITINRTALHMVYQATVSAIHHLKFVSLSSDQLSTTRSEVHNLSRAKFRDSAIQLTHMVTELKAAINVSKATFGKVGVLLPNTVNAADVGPRYRPPVDFDDMTVTGSGDGMPQPLLFEAGPIDMEFLDGHDEFSLNTIADTEFDAEQFLQFSDEGDWPQSDNESTSSLGQLNAPSL